MRKMIDYQKCFIENLKFYRKKKGFSQSMLAEACEVSNGTIGNIECGMTKPSFDLIVQMADRLGVKPETLFYTEDRAPALQEPPPVEFTPEQLPRVRGSFLTALVTALKSLKKA